MKNFKTFQVYSSYKFTLDPHTVDANFKTFQVYSSFTGTISRFTNTSIFQNFSSL